MRISSILALALLLVSCNRAKPTAPSAADMATFLADPITGTVDETASTANFSSIPKDRLLQFTACLKDVAVQERIIGARFKVVDPDGHEKKLRKPETDQAGCLYWSETFDFDATQRETFYEVERKIIATSIHQGEITVRVGVDPWQKGADSVRDLSVKGAPATTKLRGKPGSVSPLSTGDENGLVVESVETNLDITSSNSDGSSANLQLQFEPKLRHIGLNGAPVLEALTSGKFKVTAQIVAITDGHEKSFTDTLVVPDAGFKLGKVRAEGSVKLLQKIRRESSLELDFTAEPIDASVRQFGVIHGRSTLGRLTSLSFSANRELRQEKYSPSLAKAKPEAADTQVLGFELGRVSVKDVVVTELDQSGRPKAIELQFSTTIKNGITQELVLDQDFEVNGQKVTTDTEEGFIRWKEVLPFDFYAKEDFIKKTVTIKARNSFYRGTSASRVVYINPWQYETPGQVALDEEKDGVPSPSVTATAGAAELTLASVMFNFLERTFDVDAQLNLSSARKYRFEMAPEIRRMSRNKGWLNPIGLGNGRFMVNFLLETTDDDNPEVVDAQSIEMESRNGKISATVNFHLPDVRYAAVRTNLTVQVQPLDQPSSLISKPYTGTFDMLGGFAVRFEPDKIKAIDMPKRMATAPSSNGLLKYNGSELYAKAKGFEVLPNEKLKNLGITDKEMDAYINSGNEDMLWKLCALYYEPGGINPFSEYKRCSRDAKNWLGFAKTEHMRKLYRVKQAAPPEASSLGIGAGFNYSSGNSESWNKSKSKSVSVDAGVKVGIPVLKELGLDIGFGFGAGASSSESHSFSHDISHGEGRSFGEDKSISVDEIQFNIDADVDHCTLFIASSLKPGLTKYMFCAPQAQRKKWTEHYFYIYQSTRPGPIQDDGAPINDRPLIALVRGTDRYNQLKAMLKDKELTLNLTKALPVPYKLWKESEQRYDGFFPGLLTP